MRSAATGSFIVIKTFSSRTCAFDAEWVPCPDTARRLLDLPNTTSDREAFEAIWRHYAREGDERPFLKLMLSKVVTIAAVFRTVDRDGAPKLTLFGRRCDTTGEGPMIAEFLERIAEGSWQLWGFNSAAADVPIMKQRAVALGIPHGYP
jgi:3'-5' exonuclease